MRVMLEWPSRGTWNFGFVTITGAALMAVAVACSGSSPTATQQPTPTTPMTPSPAVQNGDGQGTVELMTATNGELGTILTDGSGRTLYLYEKDKPNESTCTGGCASSWPPYTVEGTPQAGEGVSADLLGTITREGSSLQVTYNGHPLYYYAADQQPGDVKGQEVGDVWYTVAPTGKAAGEGEEEEAGTAGGTSNEGY